MGVSKNVYVTATTSRLQWTRGTTAHRCQRPPSYAQDVLVRPVRYVVAPPEEAVMRGGVRAAAVTAVAAAGSAVAIGTGHRGRGTVRVDRKPCPDK